MEFSEAIENVKQKLIICLAETKTSLKVIRDKALEISKFPIFNF